MLNGDVCILLPVACIYKICVTSFCVLPNIILATDQPCMDTSGVIIGCAVGAGMLLLLLLLLLVIAIVWCKWTAKKSAEVTPTV